MTRFSGAICHQHGGIYDVKRFDMTGKSQPSTYTDGRRGTKNAMQLLSSLIQGRYECCLERKSKASRESESWVFLDTTW